MAALLPSLTSDGWRLAPIVVARFGRVALEDQIGQLLGARLALMLIGERPGLGSPDSLGAYLVYRAAAGKHRRQPQLRFEHSARRAAWDAAADTIHYLLAEARRRRLSGVGLKDERLLASAGTPELPDKTSQTS